MRYIFNGRVGGVHIFIACSKYNKYKYVFRAVGCFPGPYLAKRFYRSTYKLKKVLLTIVQGAEQVHPQGWLQ